VRWGLAKKTYSHHSPSLSLLYQLFDTAWVLPRMARCLMYVFSCATSNMKQLHTVESLHRPRL
jgi:hypothetical protein